MMASMHNTTATLDTPSFTPFSVLNTLYTSIVSKLPVRFSYVQQVHVKVKAEAAVVFVFYVLKQVYACYKSWQTKREERKMRQAIDAARMEKKKRKRNRRCRRR
ncbi:hypothetical protein M3J09_005417 [Ascochyta lentis]